MRCNILLHLFFIMLTPDTQLLLSLLGKSYFGVIESVKEYFSVYQYEYVPRNNISTLSDSKKTAGILIFTLRRLDNRHLRIIFNQIGTVVIAEFIE